MIIRIHLISLDVQSNISQTDLLDFDNNMLVGLQNKSTRKESHVLISNTFPYKLAATFQ